MATFERYFLAEKETHVEKKNPYYALLENEEAIEKEKDIHSEIMVVEAGGWTGYWSETLTLEENYGNRWQTWRDCLRHIAAVRS